VKVARVFLASVVAGLMVLAGSALAVSGYEGQVPAQVLLDGTCRGTTLVATVLDAQGNKISGVQVAFSFVQKGDSADSLAPSSDTTNAQGKASVGLSLADVPGTRVLKAKAVDSAAEGSLTLNCTHGLPPTTADGSTTGFGLPLVLLFGIAALVLVGAFSWRVVRTRA
jgi:hypothetical protein